MVPKSWLELVLACGLARGLVWGPGSASLYLWGRPRGLVLEWELRSNRFSVARLGLELVCLSELVSREMWRAGLAEWRSAWERLWPPPVRR